MEKDYGYKPNLEDGCIVFLWLLNVFAVTCMVLYKKRNAVILGVWKSQPMPTRNTPAPEEE
jgi:hypothetical protein